MKKIIIILTCFFFFKCVSANETNDIEIKYKWYKEEIEESFYHPKSEKLSGYLEDEKNIQYGEYSEWNLKYCDYSKENYLIEEKNITTYERIAKTKYIKIEFLKVNGKYCENCVKNLQIYHGKKQITHKIIEQTDEYMYLELPEEYDPSEIWFYFNIEHKFKVILLKSLNLDEVTLTYTTAARKIFIPDKNWIYFKAIYTKEVTEELFEPDDFVRNVKVERKCRVREINTYRYKLNKRYYDDNYHSFIENYIPDINDYVAKYPSNLPSNTIEITKIIEDTKYQKEYVYIDEPKEEIKPEIKELEKIIYKTKYIDKIINKIPTKIYLLITILILLIIVLIIKLFKKRVD